VAAANRVLITGASGLLGKSLVKTFTGNGWQVVAHYFSKKGRDHRLSEWISGDLSTLEKTRDFINTHFDRIKDCRVLINNYGPMIYKDTGAVSSEDLISGFQQNLISANEITSSMIRSGRVHSVVNIGFEGAGEVKPYRTILPYAIAKSGLQLLTLSYGREFTGTRFYFVSPPSLEGGDYRKPSGDVVNPREIAAKIYGMVGNTEDV